MVHMAALDKTPAPPLSPPNGLAVHRSVSLRTQSFDLPQSVPAERPRGGSFSQVEVQLTTSEKSWFSRSREVVKEREDGSLESSKHEGHRAVQELLRFVGLRGRSECAQEPEQGPPANIIRIMSENKGSPEVVASGCQALVQASSRDVQVLKEIGHKHRGISLILEVMRLHRSVVRVQESGLMALCILTLPLENRLVIKNLGGVESVIEIMRVYPGASSIQTEGCTVLANIAFQIRENKAHIGRVGGIPAILNAMQHHTGDDVLQTRACLALRNIAWGTQENQQCIGQLDGIMVLIVSMNLHCRNSAVAEQSMIALCNLILFCNENQPRFAKTEGIEVIISTMRCHPGNKIIQSHGVALLTSVVRAGKEYRSRVCAKGIDVIVKAITLHGGEEELVLKAALLLRYLAEFPEGRSKIFECGGLEVLADALIVTLRSSPEVPEMPFP